MALFQRFQQVANSDDTPNDTPETYSYRQLSRVDTLNNELQHAYFYYTILQKLRL